MDKRLRFIAAFVLVLISVCIPRPISAHRGSEQTTQPDNLTPSNTVIISNEFDSRFSQDFSVLLKHLRLEWIVLESAEVPDSVKDKNLILLGHPDSEFSGGLIRGMLSAEEIGDILAANDHHLILEKESPWMENRVIYICTGPDLLQRRDAGEELINAIFTGTSPASDWIRTTYDIDLDAGVRDDIAQYQYQINSPELPLQDLVIDAGARPPGKIAPEQAAEDVERLFTLLSHGYSGYGFYNQGGEFDQAKTNILHELSTKPSWSADAFAGLLHEQLRFIVDRHMSIGEYKFSEHSDFWYDTDLELTLGDDGYQFEAGGEMFTLVSINDADPTPFLLPSLNKEGEPVYRVGLLSKGEPSPLSLTAVSEAGERQFDVKFQRSDFDYYSKDIFKEDVIGGIPVVRMRSFSDINSDELDQFVESARDLRGEPVVIVDLRGNGGGNERWTSLWIQNLTGVRPESVFVFSELESVTSMIGRANAFVYWDHQGADLELFRTEAARYTRVAESIESGTRQPHWTGPRYPHIPLIENDTTVVVITNDLVASSGEGFVMRMSQAENVVVVGENTMGALTFGNISTHQLPNSKLMVWIPINFNLFPDQELRESVGLVPDLWVPAADAVNNTVAAIRRGTLTTYQPLPNGVLETNFIPESPLMNIIGGGVTFWLVILMAISISAVWIYFNRKKPRILLGSGLVWMFVSLYLINQKPQEPIGYGFLCISVLCIVSGGIIAIKERRIPSKLDV
jgi:hypothetical protein